MEILKCDKHCPAFVNRKTQIGVVGWCEFGHGTDSWHNWCKFGYTDTMTKFVKQDLEKHKREVKNGKK